MMIRLKWICACGFGVYQDGVLWHGMGFFNEYFFFVQLRMCIYYRGMMGLILYTITKGMMINKRRGNAFRMPSAQARVQINQTPRCRNAVVKQLQVQTHHVVGDSKRTFLHTPLADFRQYLCS